MYLSFGKKTAVVFFTLSRISLHPLSNSVRLPQSGFLNQAWIQQLFFVKGEMENHQMTSRKVAQMCISPVRSARRNPKASAPFFLRAYQLKTFCSSFSSISLLLFAIAFWGISSEYRAVFYFQSPCRCTALSSRSFIFIVFHGVFHNDLLLQYIIDFQYLPQFCMHLLSEYFMPYIT